MIKNLKNSLVLLFILNVIFTTSARANDSLSYSGRLVNTNGSPVAGPVNLKVELVYTNATSTALCHQDFTGIVLSNGVFHLKLDFNCGANGTINDVLTQVPANESAAVRVIDVTDVAHPKSYSLQALSSMPYAKVAQQLVQMGATNDQVLKWNNTAKKWEPGTVASGGGGGTITSVSGTLPISVTAGATPVVSMTQASGSTNGYVTSSDWTAFNSKEGALAQGTSSQYYRGDKSWQTLNTQAVAEHASYLYFTNARALGVPLDGFVPAAGPIVATDSILTAFNKTQGQLNSLGTAGSSYLVKNSSDSITGTVSVTNVMTTSGSGDIVLTTGPFMATSAINKAYADGKLDKTTGGTVAGVVTLDDDLKIKGGSNYVTVKGHATSANYNFVLPSSAGTIGYVLRTDGAGNLSWIDPAVTSVGGVTAANIAAGADLANAATNLNTASTIVKRDSSGNFSAGTITATLTGTATNVSGVVAVANGGTGKSTLGLNKLLYGNTTSAVSEVATTAIPSVLLSTVTTGEPAWVTSTTGFLKGSASGVSFAAIASGDLPSGTLSGSGTANYIPYYSAASTLANSPVAISGTNVSIGSTTPGSNTKLNVEGQLRSKSFSQTTAAIDWVNGNSGTTSSNCGSSITFANMRDGGSYLLAVTSTNGTQCTFSTTVTGDDAATVVYKFIPVNGVRVANKDTIYSFQRIGNIVYVSWISGF